MGLLDGAVDEVKLVDRAKEVLVPALAAALEPLLKAAIVDLVFALDGMTITISRKVGSSKPEGTA